MPTELQVRRISLPETYNVRRAVLYPNPEDKHKIHIPNDHVGIHLGAFLNHNISQEHGTVSDDTTADSVPISVISLFHEPLPPPLPPFTSPPDTSKYLRFRKFACLQEYQSRGIGSQLFLHVLDYARTDPELGPRTILWCDARWSTRDWYLKRGMTILGERFFKGSIEYIVMVIQV